ncbi:MAG: recombinase family protein [Bryobacterales bacterium]|nr:recombinase family protein [Bryobacterales bacterium]
MKNVERVREALLGLPSADYFRQRAFAGWKPVAIVWERQIDASPDASTAGEQIPYGLEVGADCATLVENPAEKQVILQVIEGIVQDLRISQIAAALNQSGYRTRTGDPWTARDVFELLPRLIEVGPRVFPTTEWAERRRQLFNAI